MGVIYKITNQNGRQYVGKTYDLRKRINAHKCASKKHTGIILLNSIKKYGWDAHKLDIIEEVADELMDEREMFWISELKTYCYDYPGQMNMTKGGEGQRSTWMHDVERRRKASEFFKGAGNGFYGKKHTEESRKIISEKASIRNKKSGWTIPEWGAEKGRNIVRRPVLCYNSNGKFLREYISVTDAADDLSLIKSSVSASCANKRSNVGGYVFRYKIDDNYPNNIDVNIKKQSVKRPIYWLSENLEPICLFPSAQEASDFFGIPKGTINRAALYNNLNPIRTGHIFLYKDMYLEAYKIAS